MTHNPHEPADHFDDPDRRRTDHPDGPAHDRTDDNADGPGAEVVPIESARAGRHPYQTPAPDEAHPDEADGPLVLHGHVVRVDQPGGDADWLARLEVQARERRPIVPLWLRSRSEAASVLKWVSRHYLHVTGYHLTRTPKYGLKLAARAPRGAVWLAGGMVRWTFDWEGEPARLIAVQRNDYDAYLKLSRQRDARVRLRVPVALVTLATLLLAGILIAASAPSIGQWTALGVALAVLGVCGKVPDRPLLDRAVLRHGLEKLTSDIVLRALGSLGIAEINKALSKASKTTQADAIRFNAPIMRDGPGWRADVDLPLGVTVSDVVEKRDRLASGLRRPLGCVWPEPMHGQHPGRMVLWVGDTDMNTARQPAWPLRRGGQADIFKPIPFGTDQRGRLVALTLMFNSMLIGAMPRVGKTFSLKPLVLAMGLDPIVQAMVFELKGTGDLSFAEKFAHEYASGLDDETMRRALLALRALKAELVSHRSGVIASLPKDLCPENKVTRALAERVSLGLHPIGLIIDECQNLFSHPAFGAEAGELAEFIIRVGPAMGVFLILATQRPDKRSLPTGIAANVGIRFSLRVMGQTENDMILGTSMYQNGIRATTFTAEDKGIGYLVGVKTDPQIVKTFFFDAPTADQIAERARDLRIAAGRLSGHAAGQAPEHEAAHGFDLLKDIASVVPTGEAKVWSETVCARLAELRPEVYTGWEPEQLAAALAPHGIDTIQISRRIDGKQLNRRGIDRSHIAAVITDRNHNRPTG
ncbi:cell division protein FtsK [Nonomuraea dietziae]|uniref:S-DNA-T family DNA segregation ATPase FtsK/SpoIIIE n=2 Tax=Nonomuraea dietziae TaxID=65515 RepID=A0A7W5V599_9ACTN|nr:cell division protein FtsK [Nonomuraea dietziae]MBB3728126.1 S-DNA-T family DNA segregation ATPase FtsK/SpoIIIE [Nonomuraea dietziae]